MDPALSSLNGSGGVQAGVLCARVHELPFTRHRAEKSGFMVIEFRIEALLPIPNQLKRRPVVGGAEIPPMGLTVGVLEVGRPSNQFELSRP